MFIQYVHALYQMKDQFLGINISFYVEKNNKLLKLQYIFCERHHYPVDSLILLITTKLTPTCKQPCVRHCMELDKCKIFEMLCMKCIRNQIKLLEG